LKQQLGVVVRRLGRLKRAKGSEQGRGRRAVTIKPYPPRDGLPGEHTEQAPPEFGNGPDEISSVETKGVILCG
jgi:hypothetical protein